MTTPRNVYSPATHGVCADPRPVAYVAPCDLADHGIYGPHSHGVAPVCACGLALISDPAAGSWLHYVPAPADDEAPYMVPAGTAVTDPYGRQATLVVDWFAWQSEVTVRTAAGHTDRYHPARVYLAGLALTEVAR